MASGLLAYSPCVALTESSGGRGGIRTHGDLSATTLFESVTINHSDTLPPHSIALAALTGQAGMGNI